MSKFKGKKTDNASYPAKREIRSIALSMHEVSNVLEVFCGAGMMYRDVWFNADSYTGIDKRKFFDERETICGDSQKALRIIDLNKYNIFDIDAYGSPYNELDYIVRNIKIDTRKTFIITDGSSMDLRMGRVSSGLRALTGIYFHELKKAHLIHDELIMTLIKNIEEITKSKYDAFKIAKGLTGSQMRYYMFSLVPESL